MFVKLPVAALKAFLDANEDCEQLSANEYVVDLYDSKPPLTAHLQIAEDGAHILAAAVLAYDAAQDGWYMGERVEDAQRVFDALALAMEAG